MRAKSRYKIHIQAIIIAAFLVFSVVGCGKKENDAALDAATQENTALEGTDIENANNQRSDDNTISETMENTETQGALTAADYNKHFQQFIDNEEPLYFDFFIDNNAIGCYTYDMIASYIEKGNAYSFADFVKTYCDAMGEYFDGYGVPSSIEYAYIDCGKDGVPELAIRLSGIEISYTDINSVLVLKLIDDKIQCVFIDEYGYRVWGTLNEYGYYVSGGSSGAASLAFDYRYIDGDGYLKYDYGCDTSNSLWAFYVPDNDEYEKVAEKQGIADNIQFDTYNFVQYDMENEKEYYDSLMYTFTPVDDNYNVLEGEDYEAAYKEGSPYMIFWESTKLPLVTPEQAKEKLKAHESKLGITEEIINGKEASWMAITGAKLNNIMAWDEKTEASVVCVENPGYEYYCANSETSDLTKLELAVASSQANEIIDEDKWFDDLNMSQPERLNFSDDIFIYQLRGTDSSGYEWYPYLMDICDSCTGETMYTLDFSNYYYPDEYAEGDFDFVEESIHWAVAENGVLYVSTYHTTYAASAPHNGYITAFDMDDNFRVLWKTEPLTCNSNNFVLMDDAIVCGYGFTAEDDFVYVLDKKTGQRTQTYKVKTGPEWFVLKDGNLQVRCYDTNYVYDVAVEDR